LSRYHIKPVWDPVTRVWHWLLAFCVIGGWLLGEYRTFSIMQWHIYFGYCTGVLLLFRLIRGIKGPKNIRFAALVPRPGELYLDVMRIIDRRPSGIAGHSPIGALASLVILVLLSIQVVSGLLSEDDDLFHEGPLADSVSSAIVVKATGIHNINSSLILIVLGMHVLIMLFYYFWKKENLVGAMISGRKLVVSDEDEADG
jgi:cytochrome b